jgi:hypothetical protein
VLQTLVLLGALALAVTTMLETQLLFAKLAIRRTADSLVTVGTSVATSAMLKQLAGEIQANGPALPLTVQPLAAQCIAPGACALTVAAVYAVTGTTVSGAGPDAAANLDSDVLTQEARTSIMVTVSIGDAAGVPIVTRSQLVTVRTFAAPPYAVITGVADAAAPTPLVAEGDSGGCVAGTASCDSNANAATTDDTRIFANRLCVPGIGDKNGGTCPSSPVDESTFVNQPWQNGNIPPAGWAR